MERVTEEIGTKAYSLFRRIKGSEHEWVEVNSVLVSKKLAEAMWDSLLNPTRRYSRYEYCLKPVSRLEGRK